MLTVYTNFLDDYIHFIFKHNHHTISIAKELERDYGITQCEIDTCDIIGRHYRINTRTKQEEAFSNQESRYTIIPEHMFVHEARI